MKTWKKIEETKKRTGDITGLKKRNEEKVQKVSTNFIMYTKSLSNIENIRYITGKRAKTTDEPKQLYALQAKVRRKEEGLGCSVAPEERRG